MAVDAQRFMDLTSYLHLIWSAPLQIGLSLYFLWAQMDVAVLGGVGIMIIMIPLNAYIARKTRKQQVLQMKVPHAHLIHAQFTMLITSFLLRAHPFLLFRAHHFIFGTPCSSCCPAAKRSEDQVNERGTLLDVLHS